MLTNTSSRLTTFSSLSAFMISISFAMSLAPLVLHRLVGLNILYESNQIKSNQIKSNQINNCNLIYIYNMLQSENLIVFLLTKYLCKRTYIQCKTKAHREVCESPRDDFHGYELSTLLILAQIHIPRRAPSYLLHD